jgi:methionine-rich copper-binding protein CopC
MALAAPSDSAGTVHSTRVLHAYYVSSNPAANATLKAPPSVVTVTFAEPVDPSGSAITIYDSHGKVVSGSAQVEQNDLKTMRVPMTGDDSEVYLVVWHTVSAQDGDPDVGAFSFFISASGVSDLVTPRAAAATPASGAPIWLTVVVGIIALLIGVAGGIYWARRTTQPAGKA